MTTGAGSPTAAFADQYFADLVIRLRGPIDDDHPKIVIDSIVRYPAQPPLLLDVDVHFRLHGEPYVWRWPIRHWDADAVDDAADFQALLVRVDLREAANGNPGGPDMSDPHPPRDA